LGIAIEASLKGTEETIAKIRVDPVLLARLQRLVASPELGFGSLEHVIGASLWSFASYLETKLRRLRGEEGSR